MGGGRGGVIWRGKWKGKLRVVWDFELVIYHHGFVFPLTLSDSLFRCHQPPFTSQFSILHIPVSITPDSRRPPSHRPHISSASFFPYATEDQM